MTKKIGVDIDAVLTDEGRGEENIWHRNICNYFDLQERKNDIYDFTEAYGLTLKEVEEFMTTKGLDIFKNVPPRPKCKEVLRRLKAKGYNIILVTARPQINNQITLEWLKKHKIPFDELIHSEKKANICKERNIEFFIDDNIDNLIPIKELEIPVLLMNMDHNQHYKGDILRVDNWLEIEEEILKTLE